MTYACLQKLSPCVHVLVSQLLTMTSTHRLNTYWCTTDDYDVTTQTEHTLVYHWWLWCHHTDWTHTGVPLMTMMSPHRLNTHWCTTDDYDVITQTDTHWCTTDDYDVTTQTEHTLLYHWLLWGQHTDLCRNVCFIKKFKNHLRLGVEVVVVVRRQLQDTESMLDKEEEERERSGRRKTPRACWTRRKRRKKGQGTRHQKNHHIYRLTGIASSSFEANDRYGRTMNLSCQKDRRTCTKATSWGKTQPSLNTLESTFGNTPHQRPFLGQRCFKWEQNPQQHIFFFCKTESSFISLFGWPASSPVGETPIETKERQATAAKRKKIEATHYREREREREKHCIVDKTKQHRERWGRGGEREKERERERERERKRERERERERCKKHSRHLVPMDHHSRFSALQHTWLGCASCKDKKRCTGHKKINQRWGRERYGRQIYYNQKYGKHWSERWESCSKMKRERERERERERGRKRERERERERERGRERERERERENTANTTKNTFLIKL